MILILKNKSIKELVQLISDPNHPVPAGGATIATTALLGISLLKLTLMVSQKGWSSKEKNNLKHHINKLDQIKESLSAAIEDDTQAFKINLKNNFNNSKDLKSIIKIPLNIAQSIESALEITAKVNNRVKDTVTADYQVAIFNLKASLKGAISIIESNYTFFPPDSPYIKEVKNKINKLKIGR